ncbi:MAG: DUF3383 family protein [Oscillospiraceae bacterium]|nr:DUF3383 family protein [Oscillospiraceae bacterium]
MSLPYSAIVPISATVSSAAFTTEKKHILLAMVNDLIPTSVPYLEFSGASAVTDFGAYFGQSIPEYTQIQKYFGFLSKGGSAPEKAVIARWFKEAAAPFIKGSSDINSVAGFKAVSDGSFKITIDGEDVEATGLNFSSVNYYSDIANVLQGGLTGKATVVYNTTTKGFIITSLKTGSEATIGAISEGTSGTDISGFLGMENPVLSQGANAETFAQFCDRIYNANSAGYSITTLEELTEDDIVPAVQWLQLATGGQTYNTVVRLVFNFKDKATAKAISATLSALSYTGYVLTYDPYGEYVNILDCAICASIDYEVVNGAINFNFQPAAGYTAITGLGTVVDYQQGLTNSSLMEELNQAKISTVYSLGFGTQEQVFYGFGLMAGAFGSEDVQVNESALEQALQLSIINALAALNKIKAQGADAAALIGSLLGTPLEQFKDNGSIARNGTLSNTDRISIAQATGNPDAADAVANNGYYFQIQPLTDNDIANRQVRVLICYLCGGVINKVQIINRIYGA